MDMQTIFKALAEFFDTFFLNIAVGTGILFVAMFTVWWLYRRLSKKDQFQLFKKKGDVLYAGTWEHTVYIMKYFLVFPFFSFLGFIVFALCLFIIGKPSTPEAQMNILFVSIVTVSTIRISAYVHFNLAEDLAKLVPLTLLGIVIANPSMENLDISVAQFQAFAMMIPTFSKYILFTVVLEAALRGASFIFRNINKE